MMSTAVRRKTTFNHPFSLLARLLSNVGVLASGDVRSGAFASVSVVLRDIYSRYLLKVSYLGADIQAFM
jgi:hypothetical protein